MATSAAGFPAITENTGAEVTSISNMRVSLSSVKLLPIAPAPIMAATGSRRANITGTDALSSL